jgi:hypothetical protein
MIDKRRVVEYTELYQALGYEVRLEGIRIEEIEPDCTDCALVMHQIFVTLYTRRLGSSGRSGLSKNLAKVELKDSQST